MMLFMLPESLAYAHFSPEASREVVFGIIWALLGGGHVPMRWRGQDVNPAWLTDRLKPEAQPEGLARVRAMIPTSASP